MCGIAGIIDLKGRRVDAADLRKMTDAIRHRGPDGEGFYVHEQVGFGHRRLAIIDLSEAGHQPMTYAGCTITYNGEIYNYLELRETLRKAGYDFHTNTDTEVLLAAYHHWGTECVQHFNGMWAFAIYDPAKQQVFCSRDRFGEKPFYYHYSCGRLLFCSELRGLLPAMEKRPAPNVRMAARYMVFEQAEHFSETFFNEVYKLPAAHCMVIDLRSGTINTAPYYSPRRLDTWRKMKEQDAVTELNYRIRHSVALRMRSDVEVGTCLSGGLDSSSVAAFATKLIAPGVQHSLTGITAGSVEEAKDETAYAIMAANAMGIAWKGCKPGPEAFRQVFPEVLRIQEEPFDSGSVVMQYFVMELAHQTGLKVLLDGQGADELLLGYKQHLAWTIKALPALSAAKLAISSLNKYQIGWRELALLLFYHTRVKAKRHRQLARWPGLKKALAQHLKEEAAVEGRHPADLFSRQSNELYHRILPMLLRYEDKNAMAFSVETRLPFLDPDLVEFLLNIDGALKVKNGWSKYLLRKANEGVLPNEIVWRTGKGAFAAPAFLPADASKAGPVAGWLREALGNISTAAPYERNDISFRVRSLSHWVQPLV